MRKSNTEHVWQSSNPGMSRASRQTAVSQALLRYTFVKDVITSIHLRSTLYSGQLRLNQCFLMFTLAALSWSCFFARDARQTRKYIAAEHATQLLIMKQPVTAVTVEDKEQHSLRASWLVSSDYRDMDYASFISISIRCYSCGPKKLQMRLCFDSPGVWLALCRSRREQVAAASHWP